MHIWSMEVDQKMKSDGKLNTLINNVGVTNKLKGEINHIYVCVLEERERERERGNKLNWLVMDSKLRTCYHLKQLFQGSISSLFH